MPAHSMDGWVYVDTLEQYTSVPVSRGPGVAAGDAGEGTLPDSARRQSEAQWPSLYDSDQTDKTEQDGTRAVYTRLFPALQQRALEDDRGGPATPPGTQDIMSSSTLTGTRPRPVPAPAPAQRGSGGPHAHPGAGPDGYLTAQAYQRGLASSGYPAPTTSNGSGSAGTRGHQTGATASPQVKSESLGWAGQGEGAGRGRALAHGPGQGHAQPQRLGAGQGSSGGTSRRHSMMSDDEQSEEAEGKTGGGNGGGGKGGAGSGGAGGDKKRKKPRIALSCAQCTKVSGGSRGRGAVSSRGRPGMLM